MTDTLYKRKCRLKMIQNGINYYMSVGWTKISNGLAGIIFRQARLWSFSISAVYIDTQTKWRCEHNEANQTYLYKNHQMN